MVYMREGLRRVRVVASIYYNDSTLDADPYIRPRRPEDYI
jgi:hypothetical protein